MTPEQYLAEAQVHLEAGRFPEATAYASMATATAAVVPTPRPQPVETMHPGKHKTGLEWCGKCYSPKTRFVRGRTGTARRCTCHASNQGEGRNCRYCSVPLRKDGETWKWVDGSGSDGCPKAPNLSDLASIPVEPDLNRDEEWAEFLQHVSTFGKPADKNAWTSDELMEELATYQISLPVTRHGDAPHARQMDAWLRDRAGKIYGKYVLASIADYEGVPVWRAQYVPTD
jgi:hypothetical protein